MKFETNDVLDTVGAYAFDEVDRMRNELVARGVDVVDFGVGDPKEPTPVIVREALKAAADVRKSSGYPRNAGTPDFLEAVRKWTSDRFGVELDKATQIASNIGSKEAVFNFPLAFVRPGDVVLVPNPGYPPYERGTLFAHGKPVFMNLLEENGFYPDFDAISSADARKAKIMWMNYPNSPTGRNASKEFIRRAIDFCHDNEIILVSDEAYSDIYFDEKPLSPLQFSTEGVVGVYSLSKRSNMTGYRVGWLAGDADIIGPYKKLKGNIDSGTATIIQDAAVAALSDERHVEEMRRGYKIKRDMMVDAFSSIGLPKCVPESTFYIWQKVPVGMTSLDFVKKLLDPAVGIVATPGSFLSRDVGGVNPGEGYVRFALVPTVDETYKAALRLKNIEL